MNRRKGWNKASLLLLSSTIILVIQGCSGSNQADSSIVPATNNVYSNTAYSNTVYTNTVNSLPSNNNCTDEAEPRFSLQLPGAKKQLETGQVRWAFMTPPLASPSYEPLFPGRDDVKIRKLLSWFEFVKPIEEENLRPPKRSQSVHLEFEDGSSITVSPAWKCKSLVDGNGNKGTECTNVENRVTISGSDVEPYFAIAPELYTFLTKTAQEWMPQVIDATYPETIKVGVPFKMAGNAWLSERVSLQIVDPKDPKKILWSMEVAPTNGHFEISATIPESTGLKPGDYTLNFKGQQKNRGSTVKIVS